MLQKSTKKLHIFEATCSWKSCVSSHFLFSQALLVCMSYITMIYSAVISVSGISLGPQNIIPAHHIRATFVTS